METTTLVISLVVFVLVWSSVWIFILLDKNSDIKSLKKSIKESQDHANGYVKTLKEYVDAVDSKVTSVIDHVKTLDTDSEDKTGRVLGLMESLHQRDRTLDKRVVDLDEKIMEVEGRVGEFLESRKDEDISEMTEWLEDIQDRLDSTPGISKTKENAHGGQLRDVVISDPELIDAFSALKNSKEEKTINTQKVFTQEEADLVYDLREEVVALRNKMDREFKDSVLALENKIDQGFKNPEKYLLGPKLRERIENFENHQALFQKKINNFEYTYDLAFDLISNKISIMEKRAFFDEGDYTDGQL